MVLWTSQMPLFQNVIIVDQITIYTECIYFSLVIQYPNGILTSFGPYDGTTHDSTAAQIVELDELVMRNYTFPGFDTCFIMFALQFNFRCGIPFVWRFWVWS